MSISEKVPLNISCKPLPPLLRWAGGKRQIIPTLLKMLPLGIETFYYREPFLGAGAMFFALSPKAGLLSDSNSHLMSFYRTIARKHESVSKGFTLHKANHSREHYYLVRTKYNENLSEISCEQSVRFFYLNKACFNGIFRVNNEGHFNVPYGNKVRPAFPNIESLSLAAKALRRMELRTTCYEESLSDAQEGDFVFLDPPYPPLSETAYFTHYTKERFSWSEHVNLSRLVEKASNKGAKIMLTNADSPLVRNLYKKYFICEIPVIRYVTCKAQKHRVIELVITNYPVRK